MSRLARLLCTLLLGGAALAQPLKQYPLPDPGFEQGGQGWARQKAANVSSDTAVAHTGAASLKLTADDQSHPYVAVAVQGLQGGATYALRAWVRGAQGAPAQVALKIEYYNAKGENTKGFYSQSLTLKGEAWQEISVEPVADPDTVRASLLVRLMSPGQAWLDDVTFAMTKAPEPVTLDPVRAAVAAGHAGEVSATVRLRDPWDRRQPQVAVSGPGGEVPGASAQVTAQPDGLLTLTAKLPALAAGDYALRLSFGGVSGTLKLFAYDLRKPTNLSDSGTLLVAGKPFFPIGAYHVSSTEYQLLADNRFNAVQGGNPASPDDFRKLVETARQAGVMLDVPFYQGGKVAANLPDTLAKVNGFQGHPAVLNWKIIDEPDLRPEIIDEVAGVYRQIRAADPAHPVLLTIASPSSFPFWVNFCDMLQVDPYPLPRNPLTQVSDTVKAAKAVLRPWQHLTAVLQCGWVMDKDKPANQPTYEQALSMVYLALINGAKGIFWYSMHDPGWDLSKTPLWARMRELNAATAEAGKLVTEGQPRPPVAVDNAALQAAAWDLDGRTQVLVTNPTPEPQTATVNLGRSLAACTCLHGDLKTELVDRGVKLSLPAYASATLAVR